MIEILKPDFVFDDERGTILQLVHEGYQQFNIVYTNGGMKRGGLHYHKYNKEAFFVIYGSLELLVTDGKNRERYLFKKGDMFMIPPYIGHDFNYLEDTAVAGLYSGCVELPDGTKDIFTDLL